MAELSSQSSLSNPTLRLHSQPISLYLPPFPSLSRTHLFADFFSQEVEMSFGDFSKSAATNRNVKNS